MARREFTDDEVFGGGPIGVPKKPREFTDEEVFAPVEPRPAPSEPVPSPAEPSFLERLTDVVPGAPALKSLIEPGRQGEPVPAVPTVPAQKPWRVLGKTTEGRPILVNPEGGLSTEISITVEDPRQPGSYMNIPSLYGGAPVEQSEAIRKIIKAGYKDPDTGRDIESYPSLETATTAAKKRSELLAQDPEFRKATTLFGGEPVEPEKDERGFGKKAVVDPLRRGTYNLKGAIGGLLAKREASIFGMLNRLDEVEQQLEYAKTQRDPNAAVDPRPLKRERQRLVKTLVQSNAATPAATGVGSLGETLPLVRTTAGRQRIRAASLKALFENLDRTGRNLRAAGNIPRAKETERAFDSTDEFMAALGRAPATLVSEIFFESLPLFAPAIAAGAATGGVGGLGFGAAAAGLNSYAIENGLAFVDAFRTAGVDVNNPQAFYDAITKDRALFEKARDMAAAKGLPIAVFDALSFGIASKALVPRALRGKLTGTIANLFTQMPVQGALGAAGEAGGQILAYGNIQSLPEILAEAIGEIGGTVVEVPAATFAASRDARAARAGQTPAVPPAPPTAVPGAAPSAPPSTPTAAPPRVSVTEAPPIATAPAAPAPGERPVAPIVEPTPSPATAPVPSSGSLEADARIGALLPEVAVSIGSAGPPEMTALARRIAEAVYPGETDFSADEIAAVATGLQSAIAGRAFEIAPSGEFATLERAGYRLGALLRTLPARSEGETAAYARGTRGEPVPAQPLGIAPSPGAPALAATGPALPAAVDAMGARPAGPAAAPVAAGPALVQPAIPPEVVAAAGAPVSPAATQQPVPLGPAEPAQGGRGGIAAAPPGAPTTAAQLPPAQPPGLTPETLPFERSRAVAQRLDPDVTARDIEHLSPGLRGWEERPLRAVRFLAALFPDLRFSDAHIDAFLAGLRGEQPPAAGNVSLTLHELGVRIAETEPSLVASSTVPATTETAQQELGDREVFSVAPAVAPAATETSVLPETAAQESPEASQQAPSFFGERTAVEDLEREADRLRSTDVLPGIAAATGPHAPGANYIGHVRDQVSGRSRKSALRREDILRPLLKDLGVALYQGRVKSRRFLGFYRRGIEEVRIKRMGDIETAAHEIAHALDDRHKDIRRQWFPATSANAAIRDELRGVSYDQTKIFEGFAEFVRLWATQEDEAKARAPLFHAWFEDWVAASPHEQALRRAQREMHAWFAQDAVTRARSKIGFDKDVNDGLASWRANFRQAVFDDLHGIQRMEESITGDIEPGGLYELARLSRGKHAVIEGALIYGVPTVKPDGSHSFTGKSLRDILTPIADDLDNFLLYAVGRSAHELKMQGREHLFTEAEITGMLALERPEFREAFDGYQDWNKGILDFAQAKGIINPDQRAKWRRSQYLPFHRVGQRGGTSAAARLPGAWRGIKALTGGTANIRDVMANIIGNAAMLIDAALTNEVRREAARVAKQKGGARFMARIPPSDRRIAVHRAQMEKVLLDALGVSDIHQLPIDVQSVLGDISKGLEPYVPFVLHGQQPGGGQIVAALIDGKPVYYEVADPLLYRSFLALNRPTKNWFVNAFGWFRRMGQMSVTLAADFMAPNILRDTAMATIMSPHGFRFAIDSAKGLVSRLTADKSYRDFVANGGGFSSYFVDERAFKKHLERFYGRKGIDYRTVLDSPAKLLYAVERIADSFEIATRIGEYERAIKRGVGPRHAAYAGREISTDFAMRGDSKVLGFFFDTVLFFKAGLNGMDRVYRGLATDKHRGKIALKVAGLALLSTGLYAINRGNPLYDDLEDWDKDSNWHFFIPKPETIKAWQEGRPLPSLDERYLHFRMPKLWEVGAVASIAERSLEGILNEAPGHAALNILNVIRQQFRLDPIPQAVRPLFELATNRVGFIDRPIETQAMQSLQPWARRGPNTSRTIAKAAEQTRSWPRWLQFSPSQAEALLRGYLNTWAMYGLSLSDAVFFDDKPDMRADQYPVVRRFYRQHPTGQTKWVTKFYDALKEATEARRTMRQMDRMYRPEIAGEIEQTPQNLEYRQLQRASKAMQTFRRESILVQEMPDLKALQKYANELSRTPSYARRIAVIRGSNDWRTLGGLKRRLLDFWGEERTGHAKRVMTEIEAARERGRK